MPANSIERLLEVMRTLRSEQGCPWDREQTLESLKPYLFEEAYEVIDAIDSGDRDALRDELGDVLLQIVFQAQICAEQGSFTFDDVARGLTEKLIRRHPHVFGEVKVSGSDEVLKNWEAIKKEEAPGKRRSAVDGIPRHLPALQKAHQVQKKAARVGFDWDEVHGVLDKLAEELQEVREAVASQDSAHIKEEIGDLLFSAVNLSRFLGHNAEEILNATISKFVRRFQLLEEQVHRQGKDMSQCDLATLDAIWNEVKASEK